MFTQKYQDSTFEVPSLLARVQEIHRMQVRKTKIGSKQTNQNTQNTTNQSAEPSKDDCSLKEKDN